jgi:hypothetical protein
MARGKVEAFGASLAKNSIRGGGNELLDRLYWGGSDLG